MVQYDLLCCPLFVYLIIMNSVQESQEDDINIQLRAQLEAFRYSVA